MNAHKSSEQVIIMHRVLKEREEKIKQDNERERQKIFDIIKDKKMHLCFNETCRLPSRVTCSRCQYADYCSPYCLDADFPKHKEDCDRLASPNSLAANSLHPPQFTHGSEVYPVLQRGRGSGRYFVL